MSLIRVDNLKLGYDGRVVLSNLSFSVEQGDFLSIIGENGSGKTTLVKGLLGLIGTYDGTIEYSDGLSRSHIGYLSQQIALNKQFPASVYEIVMSGFQGNNRFGLLYSAAQKSHAQSVMEKVGIDSLKNKSFAELSGGQQQRVLLCRALCSTQRLILLDEPTTGLDVFASTEFYQLVRQLNSDGVAVIMVSHDVTAAIQNSCHILYLGRDINFFGTTHEYLHSSVGSSLLLSGCPCDNCRHSAEQVNHNA